MHPRLSRLFGVFLFTAVLSTVPSPVAAEDADELFEAIAASDYANSTGREGSILRLYTSVFRRLPDAGGFDFWVNQNDWDLRAVAAFFASSPEFVDTYGELDDEAFVRLMYVNVLGREGEAGGVEFWIGIAGTVGRSEVVVGFSESAEYVDQTTFESSSASDYLGDYTLDDTEFGTQVTVTIDGDTRTIVSNALPDHETGEFPTAGNPNTISAQDLTYSYTTEPTFVGSAASPITIGVAVNGVKFEPGTAETVTCDSGETYRVEALQDIYNLGLDFNNAHVQPTGEYHYHGISELLAEAYSSNDDLVHVGFAADGYLMYYSKSGAYDSGYEISDEVRQGTDCVASAPLGGAETQVGGTTPDGTYTSDWVWSDASGDLDSCNGTEIDGSYAYVITDEFPFISRCLNGEVADAGGPGGGPGTPPGR